MASHNTSVEKRIMLGLVISIVALISVFALFFMQWYVYNHNNNVFDKNGEDTVTVGLKCRSGPIAYDCMVANIDEETGFPETIGIDMVTVCDKSNVDNIFECIDIAFSGGDCRDYDIVRADEDYQQVDVVTICEV